MHSDIKKFWEDAGFNLIKWQKPDNLLYVNSNYYSIIGQKNGANLVLAVSLNGSCIDYYKYYLENSSKTYSEKELLRLIKLKAFV